MPLVDLPLERLHHYAGRNPKPADFDAYWARALSELEGVSGDVEYSSAEFEAPSADLKWMKFKGVGGAELHAKVAIPTWCDGPFPTVLLFHGYAWRSPDWFTLLGWTAAGFAVIAPDVRGQGGRSIDPGQVRGNTLRGHIVRGLDDHEDKLFYRGAFLDTAQVARVSSGLPFVDRARVFAHGASQGGGLAVACAALAPEVIRKVVPVYPFLSDYLRVWEMDLAKDAYEELRLFFRIQDPLHRREEEVFGKLGYIDIQHLADRIQARTLFITGLMDAICPPSTQFAVYNKISAPKELLVYPDFGHDGLPGMNEAVIEFLRA